MTNRPFLVYADAEGRIFEWPKLEMLGASGGEYERVGPGEWLPLPPGSELFLLPQRLPVGYNAPKKRSEVLAHDPYDSAKPVQAVAAFMAPAYTQIYSAAYKTLPGAPLLPLFAYTAVGWKDGHFVGSGVRVDPDERQDFRHFDPEEIRRRAHARLKKERHNRLIQPPRKMCSCLRLPCGKKPFYESLGSALAHFPGVQRSMPRMHQSSGRNGALRNTGAHQLRAQP